VAVRLFGRSTPRSIPVPPKVAAERERTRSKRILVIGSEGHGKDVTCYSWDKFPEGFNVADFDVVILNFATFEEDQALATAFPPERLPSRESLGRLFFAERTELIAIGDPSRQIGPEPEGRGFAFAGRPSVADWLPFWFRVEHEVGSSFEVKDEEWAFYFSKLSTYEWFMGGEMGAGFQDPTHYLRAVGIVDADALRPFYKTLAETRFGRPIALAFQVAAARFKEPLGLVVDYGEQEVELVRSSSSIYWLPALSEPSGAEAVDLILAERFRISTQQRLPEWLDEYVLPIEAEIADEIAGLEAEREALAAHIAKARLRAEHAAAPRALLYEKGKKALEPVVRDALRELGAVVQEPEREGIEDGQLLRPPDAAVIEIKGRKDQIRLSDVRQVVQWAADAKLRDGVTYKPIIVGNPHCETSPSQRSEPLAPNALEYARNGEVALLTTIQVHEALRRLQQSDFDEAGFWTAVFAAKGVVEWP
jgi:hypothetical protein